MCRLWSQIAWFKFWLHHLQAVDLEKLASFLCALISSFVKWEYKNDVEVLRVS